VLILLFFGHFLLSFVHFVPFSGKSNTFLASYIKVHPKGLHIFTFYILIFAFSFTRYASEFTLSIVEGIQQIRIQSAIKYFFVFFVCFVVNLFKKSFIFIEHSGQVWYNYNRHRNGR